MYADLMFNKFEKNPIKNSFPSLHFLTDPNQSKYLKCFLELISSKLIIQEREKIFKSLQVAQ